ncbi:P63C domain-containing protein [Methylomagnum ishizawai]|uniref:P63C domain-containing protein n=1 Tax=Methylomagnum ishizawai TaxID=1760988 RepID=UPI001C332914|nr:P63C domain-containing protein [Methylomagnum ishizawai]BBL75594.1 hypothetical protein MishRS11D_26920 [Methylomagnum ishizawai]
MSEERKGRARGGVARAQVLSPEKRKEIAKKAAESRWGGEGMGGNAEAVKATHGSPDHPLRIGNVEIPCYVLEDGRRVLNQRGMFPALGISKGSTKSGGDRLAAFVAQKTLEPFINSNLIEVTSNPIRFRTPRGALAFGYEATVLADICDAVLEARKSGALSKQQEHIGAQAEMLVRAFARVGIIALVDEATGYQEVRDRQALQAILDAYLRKEFAAWAKRFPDEFYEQIFKLRQWEWRGRKVNPPQVVAHYTKDIVYARLAPGILEELQKRTPTESGKRKPRFHQWLTEDVGHPALAQHLHAVITLMRVSSSWDQFKMMLDIAHPRRGDTLQLPFMSDDCPAEP